jgi:intracellular sulfur oxidation DsrE/DsrF family protein
MKNLFILLLILANFNLANAKTKHLIQGYGDFKPVPNLSFKTPKKLKAVFDVYTSNDNTEELNRGINTVARYINMHIDAGVELKNIKAAIVFHGAAGKDILNNKAYNKRYITDNPNTELLNKLHDAGVQIIACGQTVEFRNYQRDEVLDFVDISLSAITALISLQTQGYQLITFN